MCKAGGTFLSHFMVKFGSKYRNILLHIAPVVLYQMIKKQLDNREDLGFHLPVYLKLLHEISYNNKNVRNVCNRCNRKCFTQLLEVCGLSTAFAADF